MKPMKAPPGLAPDTAKWFRAVCRDYVLEDHHVRLLTLACRAWDRAEQARELIALEGLTTKDRYGTAKAHPAVAIERDCRIGFARLIRELDLDVSPPAQERGRPPALFSNRRA